MDKLTTNRKYDAYCGKDIAFDFAASYILEHTSGEGASAPKVAVVSDRIVSGYYYNRFENQFIERGIKPVLVPVECKESGKSLSAVETVFRYINDGDYGRDDWIIALGGGGVGDVAAFVAGTIDSGIRLMSVPTTLCGMTEVCVSGKAFLNCGSRKDQISVRTEPDVVLADPSFLSNLPQEAKFNGYASVIRYSILEDINLMLKLSDPGNLREYLNDIYAARTEIEKKNPLLLTLGNEIAAAIEGYFRFMNYSEGEALALSLLASVDERRRTPMKRIYEALGLPVMLQGVSGKMIMKNLREQIGRMGQRMEIVDFIESDGGLWEVREVDRQEALEILGKRLSVISDWENNT